jgi:sugar phosphate isomerase/epimerase
MYLAMDEIGSDNVTRLRRLKDRQAIWVEIDHIAHGFGVKGIQFTPTVYEQALGLSLRHIPDAFRKYRLTYHIAGIRSLASSEDEEQLETLLRDGMSIACENRMEDVSLHPPRLACDGDGGRASVRSAFSNVLARWLPRYAERGVSLSVESHVFGVFFVFDGLVDFSEFVGDLPGLGVLIDISHLWNDGYDVDEVVSAFEGRRVTGLHLGDALANEELARGTHLPVGKGEVDFGRFLSRFAHDDSVYGALEIKGLSSDIVDSAGKLLRHLGADRPFCRG